MYETPPIRIVVVPTLVCTFLFFFIGVMLSFDAAPGSKGSVIGAVTFGGFVVALFWTSWIVKNFVPGAGQVYASETEQIVTERVTLVIRVPGLPDKLIHGISYDELQSIGQCVTHNGLYVFSVQHFKDYFRNSGMDGYSLYNKSVRWMQDAKALVPNAKGGFDVTEHIGKHVFNAMRDENWEVIREHDTPLPASRI